MDRPGQPEERQPSGMKASVDDSHAAALREEIRDAIAGIGMRMPKGFGIKVVGDGRLCSGFKAHHTQSAGEGRIDHGDWPFVAGRPLRAARECLAKAVDNVLMRIALEQRDEAIDRTQAITDEAWYAGVSPLGALNVSLRMNAGLPAFDVRPESLVGVDTQEAEASREPLVTIKTGRSHDVIILEGDYPETVLQNMIGRPLREIIVLPSCGRPDVDAAIHDLLVANATTREGFDDLPRLMIVVEAMRTFCAMNPPEDIDPTWLTVRPLGLAKLDDWLEDRKKS